MIKKTRICARCEGSFVPIKDEKICLDCKEELNVQKEVTKGDDN